MIIQNIEIMSKILAIFVGLFGLPAAIRHFSKMKFEKGVTSFHILKEIIEVKDKYPQVALFGFKQVFGSKMNEADLELFCQLPKLFLPLNEFINYRHFYELNGNQIEIKKLPSLQILNLTLAVHAVIYTLSVVGFIFVPDWLIAEVPSFSQNIFSSVFLMLPAVIILAFGIRFSLRGISITKKRKDLKKIRHITMSTS
jgi:hypothetical protein